MALSGPSLAPPLVCEAPAKVVTVNDCARANSGTRMNSHASFRGVVFSLVMVRSRAVLAVALLCFASSAFAQYSFTHFAGSIGGAGYDDGDGAAARFKFPVGLAVDRAGSIYVADSGNHTIRKISPQGAVSTFAGVPDQWGTNDGRLFAAAGNPVVAHFNNPDAVAVDGDGNVYVADTVNQAVRKISNGVVTTFAGFGSPEGVAVDAVGNVYVAETSANTIRKIARSGQITTLAGLAGSAGSSDGTGSAARFNHPAGIAVDAAGNVIVADAANDAIRKITAGGVVTTIAGLAGSPGSTDGVGSAARFKFPAAVAVDGAGVIYVADQFNGTIREITPGGAVSTLAGNPEEVDDIDIFVSADGTGSAARFIGPSGIAVDGAGNIYVADTISHTIRHVTAAGVVTTFAGSPAQAGLGDGAGRDARFHWPYDVAVDDAGNLYVADQDNHAVRRITPAGMVSTVAGRESGLNYPSGIAVDGAGTIYVANTGDHTIRKISGGVVSTLAGLAGVPGSSDGTGSAARFDTPFGIAVDSAGNVFVADSNNDTIRKITPAGVVTTVAGLARSAGSTDGSGSAARFFHPFDLVVDGAGTIWVADMDNQTIRRITSAGVVTTYAGQAGLAGGTDGTGPAARFANPRGITLGRFGLYVVDGGNMVIRRIRSGATVETIGGSAGYSGSSDGSGFEARFNNPRGVAVDRSENLYVTDISNHAIRVGAIGGDHAAVFPNSGSVGTIRQLHAYPQSGTAWRWELIVRPPGSTAQLSSAAFPNPLFIPDVPGRYIFRLRATGAAGVSVSTAALDATPEQRQRPARH